MKLTPEHEQRIRELIKLITNVKDPEKVRVLAGELGRLLTEQVPLRKPSDTQVRIIERVAQGLKNREIAEQLGMNTNVVRNYLGSIYKSIGVNNRLELALWYEKQVHEGKLRRGGAHSSKPWVRREGFREL